MSNRFKKKMQSVAEDITKKDKKDNDDIEIKSSRSIEFYEYQNLPITNSKNGDKFKANFSFDKATMQKLNLMQMYGGLKKNENSKLPATAIDILYLIFQAMKEKNINIFELDDEEILNQYFKSYVDK